MSNTRLCRSWVVRRSDCVAAIKERWTQEGALIAPFPGMMHS